MGEAAGEVTGWAARPDGDDVDVGAGVTGDAEVDQLVDEIEVTREEMTVTVEEIGDRLDPRNIVNDAKETVREATVGKVEQMATTAGDMVSNAGQTAQEAGSGLVDTIRRNPVPAAMVGIGLGWLAMSARSSSSTAGWSQNRRYDRYQAYSNQPGAWDTGTMGGDAWASRPTTEQGLGDRVGQFGETAGDKVSQVQQTAGDKVSQVQQTAGDKVSQVQEAAGQVPYQVQGVARQVGDNAGRMYQENPLAMGAIAVAVGAAVGLALPVTPVERNVLAKPASQALGKAEEAASQALGQAEQTARDAEQQVREEDQRAKAH